MQMLLKTNDESHGRNWGAFVREYWTALRGKRDKEWGEHPRYSLRRILQKFMVDHPWPSLFFFALPVLILLLCLPIKLIHELAPETTRSVAGSLPTWITDKVGGLKNTTSIDIFGALGGILVGILVTLIVERRSIEKDEEHGAIIRSLSKLQPIEKYRDILETIHAIIRDCTYELKDGKYRKRRDHKFRDLFFLNPTAVFGHTLKHSIDTVLETVPENRASHLRRISPNDFRIAQAEIHKHIEENYEALKDMGRDSSVHVHFATLDCDRGPAEGNSYFESEYLDGVLAEENVCIEVFNNDAKWTEDILTLVDAGSRTNTKPIYLVHNEEAIDEDGNIDGGIAQWLRSSLKGTQKKAISHLRAYEKEGRNVTYYPLSHVPFQIVMSYNERDGEGWCIFFVANRYNLPTSSNVAAFTTADRKFLNMFREVFTAVTRNYPSTRPTP